MTLLSQIRGRRRGSSYRQQGGRLQEAPRVPGSATSAWLLGKSKVKVAGRRWPCSQEFNPPTHQLPCLETSCLQQKPQDLREHLLHMGTFAVWAYTLQLTLSKSLRFRVWVSSMAGLSFSLTFLFKVSNTQALQSLHGNAHSPSLRMRP